jgi:hypothetical protein
MYSKTNPPGDHGGYSASVDIRLRVNGCFFPAAQVAHDQVILRNASSLPAGPAEIIATIDGAVERWPVLISDREQVRRIIPIVLQPTSDDSDLPPPPGPRPRD